MSNRDDTHRKLYIGTLDGVCAVSTSDAGVTWKQGKISPLANAAARFSVSAPRPERAYLAAYEAGVYRTDDGGDSWEHLDSYPSEYAHSVLAHPSQAETVLVGSEPAAVFRSSDGGDSWTEVDTFQQVPESGQWNFHGGRLSHIRELKTVPGNPEGIYAGIEVGGVVRSRDGGTSWQQLHGTDDDVHWVNICETKPDRIFLATASAPYRSDDGGDTWELINNGLERRYTLHIAASPNDADLVLVTVSSNAGRGSPLFYRSKDAGQNWALVEAIGNDDDMVVAIDWDPANEDRVYAATDHGKLYCSYDAGQEWERLPVEFPAIAIGSLAVAPSGS